MLCLSPFMMLCHLFPAFLYQLLLNQTHEKPTAKHRIVSKDHRFLNENPPYPQNKSFLKPDTLPFPFMMLCHLFHAFLYQLIAPYHYCWSLNQLPHVKRSALHNESEWVFLPQLNRGAVFLGLVFMNNGSKWVSDFWWASRMGVSDFWEWECFDLDGSEFFHISMLE